MSTQQVISKPITNHTTGIGHFLALATELPNVLKACCDGLGIFPTGPDQGNPRKVSY